MLGSLISFIDESVVAIARWIRSRAWWWGFMMFITGGRYQRLGGSVGYLYNPSKPDDLSEDEEEGEEDEDGEGYGEEEEEGV